MPMIHLVVSNLKTWLNGIHHGVSAKHLQACLNEFTFRFNRRFYPFNACQSAPKRDPRSAPKRDPAVLTPDRRPRFPPLWLARRVALAPAELVGVVEPGRAR